MEEERKEKKEVQRGKTVDVEVDAFTSRGSYAVPKGSQPVGRSSSVWFSSTLYGLV